MDLSRADSLTITNVPVSAMNLIINRVARISWTKFEGSEADCKCSPVLVDRLSIGA